MPQLEYGKAKPGLGFRLLQQLADDHQELGVVESSPKQDGRNMIMVVAPHRNTKITRASREDEPENPGTAVPPAPTE